MADDDDMPALEPTGPQQTQVQPQRPREQLTTEVVDIDADTQWTPTDTYGSTKKKLELANRIIEQLKQRGA